MKKDTRKAPKIPPCNRDQTDQEIASYDTLIAGIRDACGVPPLPPKAEPEERRRQNRIKVLLELRIDPLNDFMELRQFILPLIFPEWAEQWDRYFEQCREWLANQIANLTACELAALFSKIEKMKSNLEADPQPSHFLFRAYHEHIEENGIAISMRRLPKFAVNRYPKAGLPAVPSQRNKTDTQWKRLLEVCGLLDEESAAKAIRKAVAKMP